MIFHKYIYEIIVPSNEVNPDAEKMFSKTEEAWGSIGWKVHGVKYGKDEDYTKGMTIILTPKPEPPPQQPKSPEKQVENLKKSIEEKVE